eukprot:6212710-Pleurochrysis_carterae.AAC.1
MRATGWSPVVCFCLQGPHAHRLANRHAAPHTSHGASFNRVVIKHRLNIADCRGSGSLNLRRGLCGAHQVDVAAGGDGVDGLDDGLADDGGEHARLEGGHRDDLLPLVLIDARQDTLHRRAQLSLRWRYRKWAVQSQAELGVSRACLAQCSSSKPCQPRSKRGRTPRSGRQCSSGRAVESHLHRVRLEVCWARGQHTEGGGVDSGVERRGDCGVAEASLRHRRPRALAAVEPAVDLHNHGAALLQLDLRGDARQTHTRAQGDRAATKRGGMGKRKLA